MTFSVRAHRKTTLRKSTLRVICHSGLRDNPCNLQGITNIGNSLKAQCLCNSLQPLQKMIFFLAILYRPIFVLKFVDPFWQMQCNT